MIIYTTSKRNRRDWSATYYWDKKLREWGLSVNYAALYNFIRKYYPDRVRGVLRYIVFEHGENTLKQLYKRIKRSKIKKRIEQYFLEKIMS